MAKDCVLWSPQLSRYVRNENIHRIATKDRDIAISGGKVTCSKE